MAGPSPPADGDPPGLIGWRMLAAIVFTGVAAGVGGVALTLLLHGVQHVSFGYTEDTFLTGVERASPARRVLALAVGGLAVGTGWWLQRRHIEVDVSVGAALARPDRPPRLSATLVDSVLQIVAVGIGASLGREGAPRQLGAAAAGWTGDRLQLGSVQRRTLLACGAGAGLAAVYNVPLGGAAFTLEILLASVALTDALPALLTCAIATVVAWPVLSDRPTYAVASFSLTPTVLVWALLLGPIAGLVSVGFVRLTDRAQRRTPSGWHLPLMVTTVFAALGALAIPFPQLLGNGKGPAQLAFDGALTVPLFAALTVLKPLTTAACLRSGAKGGLLTPALATGALLGATTGELWNHVWAGAPAGAYAIIGAAAVLSTTQRAPITAIVLTLEFTHTGQSLLAPMMLAIILAGITAAILERRTSPDHDR